jgi:hypothetical protein
MSALVVEYHQFLIGIISRSKDAPYTAIGARSGSVRWTSKTNPSGMRWTIRRKGDRLSMAATG